MPRVTRAALRSQELHADPASVPLPLTPIKGRTPLGEASGNVAAEPSLEHEAEGVTAATKKGSRKGKKVTKKVVEKEVDQENSKMEKPVAEVLEDDNQSQSNSAADEACKDLLDERADLNAAVTAVDEAQSHTPSAAASEAANQLSPKPITASSDPEDCSSDIFLMDNCEKNNKSMAEVNKKDSTPAEVSEAGMKSSQSPARVQEDSFVEQIKTRTPAKRISRIEDSVEALDALEEEIEKVGGLIVEPDGPMYGKTKKQTNSPIKVAKSTPKISSTAGGKSGIKATRDSQKATTSKRLTASRASIQKAPANSSRPSGNSATDQKQEAAKTKASRDVSQPSASAHKKRLSSIHKAPFQPEKSTKPPTRATFELPGEAVARKLKEQREERLKREAEASSKESRPKPKPRPAPRKAPEVKLTATARARLSLAKGESITPAVAKDEVRKPRPSMGPAVQGRANGRLSSLSITKRGENVPPAKSSSHGTRAPSLSMASTARKRSLAGAPKAEDLKLKGKEVFGRAKVEMQERDNARKEKEEAAKKARADAAERGRIASRAWAEQQKLRKLEAEKAKKVAKVGN